MVAGEKTILVVDGDGDIVETMKMVPESAGCLVETAANGAGGFNKAREVHPDAGILDVMMDRESGGSHVSYELSKTGDARDIPILVPSATGHKSGFEFSPEEDGDYQPVDAYMEKSLEPGALVGKIAELVAK